MSRAARTPEALAGLALAGLGAFVTWRALGWDLMTWDGPGPGFFPLGYGVLMLSLSLWLVAGTLLARPAGGDGIGWAGHARALGTWAVFAAIAVAMDAIGFVAGFALLTLFLVRVVFARPWGVAVVTALGCAGGFWLLFVLALGVDLPRGPWGF